MSQPIVIVLGGINGAGKTTASRQLLAGTLNLMTFVNADVIAQGLSGFDPEAAAVEAGRMMLDRVRALAAQRRDFAFETTLVARSYSGWLDHVRQDGYAVHLFYFWLKSADLAVSRVVTRVRAGRAPCSGRHRPPAVLAEREEPARPVRAGGDELAGVRQHRVHPPADRRRRTRRAGNGSRLRNLVQTEGGSGTWLTRPRTVLAKLLTDRIMIDDALAEAVRESLLTHAKMGRSVPHQSNGQVVWVTPAEIFARYGLDENGRPKS